MFHKTRLSTLIVGALILAGCNKDAEQPAASVPPPVETPAATTDAPAAAAAQTGTLVVDEAQVVPAASDILTKADWTGKNCSLDSVDAMTKDIAVAKGQPHVFKGFLIGHDDAAPGAFSLILKGSENYEIPVSTGAARPDVAEFFKNPALGNAGYDVSTTLASVPAGNYEVWMLIRKGERTFFCEAGQTIAVN